MRLRQGDTAFRHMFEARKRVFVDLLKWDVPVLEGRYEIDQFDTQDAEYLIIADEDGAHCASARLLPTDGPHILGDLFGFLCQGPLPTGATVREITRFCLDPRLRAAERRTARDQLVSGLVDHALGSGITRYTGVACPAWFEQIVHFGWTCRTLGAPVTVGSQALVALEIEIDQQTPAALKRTGIYRSSANLLAGLGEVA